MLFWAIPLDLWGNLIIRQEPFLHQTININININIVTEILDSQDIKPAVGSGMQCYRLDRVSGIASRDAPSRSR